MIPHKFRIFYLSTTACTVLTTTPQGNYGNYNITIRRPDVHVTCVNDTTIAGSSNVTCKNDGWIPKFPHCLVNCPPIPERPDITTIDTIYYVEVRSSHLIYIYNINNRSNWSSLCILESPSPCTLSLFSAITGHLTGSCKILT